MLHASGEKAAEGPIGGFRGEKAVEVPIGGSSKQETRMVGRMANKVTKHTYTALHHFIIYDAQLIV